MSRNLRLRLLTVCALLVAVAAGCGSGAQASGVTLKVDKKPFRVTLLRDGKVVVAQDSGARLRYQITGTGEQYHLTNVISAKGSTYTVATNEPGRTAVVTVATRSSGLALSLTLRPASGVQQVYDAFDVAPSDHFLGGGTNGDRVDLHGQIVAEKVSYQCAYIAAPFFASSAGWGLRLATQNVSALAFPGSPGGAGCAYGSEDQCGFPPLPDRAEVCVQGARLDEQLYTGSPTDVLAAYQRDTGPPLAPPISQYALMKWRDVVSGPDEILEDVSRLRAEGIPIGWVILDNPWETCVGSLTFDTNRIPDPAGLIKTLHAQHIKLMLWISPKVTCPAGGYQPSELIGSGAAAVINFSNGVAVGHFQAKLRALVALGIDGVKGDRGDEVDLEPRGAAAQNAYAVQYATASMAALPKGAAAIFRAGYTGEQRVLPAVWGGDQPGDWVGLQRAIRGAATASMSGFPVWGSDVGGYASAGVTAEVFARWAGLGAVSPVMEVGGIGGNATPWVFGAPAMRALRNAAVLHYELFPYLYALGKAGLPALRPLGYGYPSDSGSWSADLELLVGDDLLAAPVTGPGESPSVYLPPGTWFDLTTGASVVGGTTFTRPTAIDVLPLYVRAGAVIPFNLRTPTNAWWGTDELTHQGRVGFLATSGAKLALTGQPHDVQLFIPAAVKPSSVTIGGKAVAFTWVASPLAGAVVRLHGPTVTGAIALR